MNSCSEMPISGEHWYIGNKPHVFLKLKKEVTQYSLTIKINLSCDYNEKLNQK